MPEPDSDSTSWSQRIRAARWLWISLAALIAIRAALPSALEWAIPRFAERRVGTGVEIDNIDLGLLRGWFAVEGLRVARAVASEKIEESESPEIPPESKSPSAAAIETPSDAQQRDLLSIDRVRLEIDWLELFRAHVSLPLIRVDGLALRVDQNRDGSFALPVPPSAREAHPDEMAETDPREGASAGDTTSPQPVDPDAAEDVEADEVVREPRGWRFSIGRFELNGPDMAVRSERTGGEVAHLALKRFAADALTAGSAGVELGDIEFEAPEGFVERDWLLDPGLAGGGEAEAEGATRPPALQIERLAISSGQFRIRSASGPIESAIRIEILGFDTEPGQTFPIEIALDVGDGGVELKGRLGIFPPAFEGEVAWQNLSAPPYLLLMVPAVAAWLASCNAEGRLDLRFRSQESADLVLRGEVRLSDLAFRQPETRELAFEAQSVSMQLREANVPLEAGRAQRFDIASLEFENPKVVFTNPPDALDELLGTLTPAPPAAADDAAARESESAEAAATPPDAGAPIAPDSEPGPTLALNIEALKVSGGELVFADRSVTPLHETRIRDFRLDATDLTTSPQGVAQIEMAGLIQKSGTFEIKGELPGGQGVLHVQVRRLELASYSGFARGAGLNLHGGDASLESAIELRDGGYHSKNDLVLRDLRVDAAEPGAFASSFGVSLDLALAMLRGPRGDIKLALPVSFHTSGSNVGIGSLVRSALKQAFAGALTSPLKLVGNLLPTGSEEPASSDPIAFEPGESGLSDATRKRIAPLVDLLKDRPGLGFTLRGQTGPVDEPGLAYAVLRDRAVAGEGLPELEGAGFFARRRLASALRERAEGREGLLESTDEALLSRYVEAQEVPIERYDGLAQARAESVMNALIAAGAPTGALAIGAPAKDDTPGVVIDLGLRNREP